MLGQKYNNKKKSYAAQSVAWLSCVLFLCVTLPALADDDDDDGKYHAQLLNLPDNPIESSQAYIPMVMLTMGRNHKLFTRAYNDSADLNDDGVVDIGFKPYILYYGYFNQYACYQYNNGYFAPTSRASSASASFYINDLPTTQTYHDCASGGWSGNFLNYLTTSRMDVIRKALYGGKRVTDTAKKGSAHNTILERAYIPYDAHTWGLEYQSVEVNGYDVEAFTDLKKPSEGTFLLFVNNTNSNSHWEYGVGVPRFSVLNNTPFRLQDWILREKPIGLDYCGARWTRCVDYSRSSTAYHFAPIPESYLRVNNSKNSPVGLTQTIWASTQRAKPNFNFINQTAFENFFTLFTKPRSDVRKTPEFRVTQLEGRGNPFGQVFTNDGNSISPESTQYWTTITGYIDSEHINGTNFGISAKGLYELKINDKVVFSNYTDMYSNDQGMPIPFTPYLRNNVNQQRILSQNLSGIVKFEFRHIYIQDVPNINNTFDVDKQILGGSYALYQQRTFPKPFADTFNVRVAVCTPDFHDTTECENYNGIHKPIGTLHTTAKEGVLFGLFTGSYTDNTEGGLLRKEISDFNDEINPDGTFVSYEDYNNIPNALRKDTNLEANMFGITWHLNQLRIYNFDNSNLKGTGTGSIEFYTTGNCSNVWHREMNNGECTNWGNPMAEIMYDVMRYFQHEKFVTGDRISNSEPRDRNLPNGAIGFRRIATPNDPFALNISNIKECGRPYSLVISDIFPNYDANLPGSPYGEGKYNSAAYKHGKPNFQNIMSSHIAIDPFSDTKPTKILIGQSGGQSDGTPSPKSVTNLSTVRGIAPEEPSRNGSYYSAAVAWYGANTNLRPDIISRKDPVNMHTMVLGFPSPVPNFVFNIQGHEVGLVPFGKSVVGRVKEGEICCYIGGSDYDYKPTTQVVSVLPFDISKNYGRLLISYEDAEQGMDYDMDNVIEYRYLIDREATPPTITISLSSIYASSSSIQHLGFAIAGTTEDNNNPFLVVRDCDTNTPDGDTVRYCRNSNTASNGDDIKYKLDYPRNRPYGMRLPLRFSKTFEVGNSSAKLLDNPLRYAAFYGRTAKDEMDENYFLVKNPNDLSHKITQMIHDLDTGKRGFSGTSVTSTIVDANIKTDTYSFKGEYHNETWVGQLEGYKVDKLTGIPEETPSLAIHDWVNTLHTCTPTTGRSVVTYNGTRGVNLNSAELTDEQRFTLAQYSPNRKGASKWSEMSNGSTLYLNDMINYLKGASLYEATSTCVSNAAQETHQFKTRPTLFGPIVHNAPSYVGAPAYYYPLSIGDEYASYATFKKAHAKRNLLISGTNAGYLHVFDLNTQREVMAYMPSSLFDNVAWLAQVKHAGKHKFGVDGDGVTVDAYYDDAWHTVYAGSLRSGGQSVFALDITDPATSNAADTVLWEFTDTHDADMGLSFSAPAIVKLAPKEAASHTAGTPSQQDTNNKGQWYALFGNGYNNMANDSSRSKTGEAALFGVTLTKTSTGNTLQCFKLLTNEGYKQDPLSDNNEGRNNGLSTPAIVDIDGDGVAEYAYAGDLFGTMWRFDLQGLTTQDATKKGCKAYKNMATKLFQGDGKQAITTRPEVTTASTGTHAMHLHVYFGTGKLLETSDIYDQKTENDFYGVIDTFLDDPTKLPPARTKKDLIKHEIEQEVSATEDIAIRTIKDITVRYVDDKNKQIKYGWHLPLISPVDGAQGERVVFDPQVRNERIIFPTLLSRTLDCTSSSYSGWLMELISDTGKALDETPFRSVNNIPLDDKQTKGEAGIKFASGAPMKPSIVKVAGQTYERKIIATTGAKQEQIEESVSDSKYRETFRQIH